MKGRIFLGFMANTDVSIWCGFLWFHFWKTRKEKVYYEGVGNSNTALVGEPVEPRRMNGDYEDVRI